jgi:putative photosynthetic complex assembly protein
MQAAAKPFPRKVLIAAAVLIAVTIGGAATARWTGVGANRTPASLPAALRELRFEDRADGSISVYQADNGQIIDTLAPGTNGFVRIVMRSLARERRMNDQGATVPFRLVRWQDGRLSMDDPATGRNIEISAFGSANIRSFARLMSPGGGNP